MTDRIAARTVVFAIASHVARIYSTRKTFSTLWWRHTIRYTANTELHNNNEEARKNEGSKPQRPLRVHMMNWWYYRNCIVSSNASAMAAPGKDHKIPHAVKQTGQEPGCKIIPRFQILIASVVRICRQSANCFSFWGTSLYPYRGFARRPRWGLLSPDTPNATVHQMDRRQH